MSDLELVIILFGII